MKGNTHSLHIPKGRDVFIGEFAKACLENGTVCDSFTISLLVYIEGLLDIAEDVHLIDSLNRGPYHIKFMVTRKINRLEGHAFVVGGDASNILERKIEFPATDAWVHVALAYSVSGTLDLYVNSVVGKESDPVIRTPWQHDRSAVQVVLGSTENKRDIFISYFQIIKGSLSNKEVTQLEKESRQQGKGFVKCCISRY